MQNEFPRKQGTQHKDTEKEIHEESPAACLGSNCPHGNPREDAFGDRDAGEK